MNKKLAKLAALGRTEPLRTLFGAFKTRFKNGEIFLVGGSVRDALLGRDGSKDFDIVVRGVTPAAYSRFTMRAYVASWAFARATASGVSG